MPRASQGGPIEERSGVLYLRPGVGGERRYLRLAVTTREQAAERRTVLARIVRDLEGQPAPMVWGFLERAASADANTLRDVLRLVAGVRAGKVRAASSATGDDPPIEAVAEQWFSGELARRFPDYVKAKATADDDESRFRLYIAPVVKGLPIKAFTLEHAETVMGQIPADKGPGTRRQVAQVMHRLMAMAVFPLRLRPDNPLPRGFLPRVPNNKAKAFLYPAEEARLVACAAIPVVLRLLYGFLAREGMRIGEAIRLTWSDLDLTRAVVNLDKTKSDEPRCFALSPGVGPALVAWREVLRDHRVDVSDGAHVFMHLDGSRVSPVVASKMAGRFRVDLQTAGVDRAALFERNAHRIWIRVHDLRATFVTLSLAAGRSEAWVTDRTGHKSSLMVARYKRAARMAEELQLGELASLDTAIPELARRSETPLDSPPTPEKSAAIPLAAHQEPQQFQPGSPARARTGTPLRATDFKKVRTVSPSCETSLCSENPGDGSNVTQPLATVGGASEGARGALAATPAGPSDAPKAPLAATPGPVATTPRGRMVASAARSLAELVEAGDVAGARAAFRLLNDAFEGPAVDEGAPRVVDLAAHRTAKASAKKGGKKSR